MVRITRQDLEDLTNLEQKGNVPSDYISALRYLSSGKFADLSLNEQVQRVESNTMLDKYTIMFLIKLRSMQNLQHALRLRTVSGNNAWVMLMIKTCSH